uniref:Uncharacterized protein n=2 Tax=Micrurus carvalhoi TaxID=3147026 RepID=A0A2H6ND99_9SAUR
MAGSRIDAALNTIATEQDKLRTAVYQNRLALDYLLAAEGGVCGKFNLTNCCLQINPVGKVVVGMALLGLLLLPCLMPIIWNVIQSTEENVVTTTHQKQVNMTLRSEVIPYCDNPAAQKAAFIMTPEKKTFP